MIHPDGTRITHLADGTATTLVLGPDPRFGMQAPVRNTFTVTTPGGLSSTTTTQRTVTLGDPANVLSLQSLADTVNANGKTFIRSYNGNTRVLTDTTPQGRTRTVTFDVVGHVTQDS